jgi:hypothetical protein
MIHILMWHLGGDDRDPLYTKSGRLRGWESQTHHGHRDTQFDRDQTKIVIFQRLVEHNDRILQVSCIKSMKSVE